jgi:hypothetical protein
VLLVPDGVLEGDPALEPAEDPSGVGELLVVPAPLVVPVVPFIVPLLWLPLWLPVCMPLVLPVLAVAPVPAPEV